MKLKFADRSDVGNIQETILLNRGVDDPEHYLNTTPADINHYSKLMNIDEAYTLFNDAVEKGVGIGVMVDSDPDGQCSASIMCQVLRKKGIEPRIYIHESKEHGLRDKNMFSQIVDDVRTGKIRLLIVPDAGTSDASECKTLSTLGCKIIVLDHHEVEKENHFAIIVNPNLSPDYSNKFISGTGVVWQFVRKIDDEDWTDYADSFLDLVAYSIVADNMDIRSYENKEFIRQGLSCIKNKLLLALFEKLEFSTKGEVNPTTIGFYVNPALNGLVRVGTQEEKRLMFDAFCQLDQEFDYEKRDHSIVKESIYDRVARLATNAKQKQDRQIEKGIEVVEADIAAKNRNNNKILFARADDLDKAFIGLVAQKLASRYNKPCILLRLQPDGKYTGSIRNFNGSPLADLKAFLTSLNRTVYITGHANAAGIGFTKAQLVDAIDISNQRLAEYDFSRVHHIDFVLQPNQLNRYVMRDLYDMREHYGKTIPEALILIEGVRINSSDIVFMGEKKNTWKFSLGEDIEVIKFKLGVDDPFFNKYAQGTGWTSDDLCINMVVKVSQNEFRGVKRWQLIVEDYEWDVVGDSI